MPKTAPGHTERSGSWESRSWPRPRRRRNRRSMAQAIERRGLLLLPCRDERHEVREGLERGFDDLRVRRRAATGDEITGADPQPGQAPPAPGPGSSCWKQGRPVPVRRPLRKQDQDVEASFHLAFRFRGLGWTDATPRDGPGHRDRSPSATRHAGLQWGRSRKLPVAVTAGAIGAAGLEDPHRSAGRMPTILIAARMIGLGRIPDAPVRQSRGPIVRGRSRRRTHRLCRTQRVRRERRPDRRTWNGRPAGGDGRRELHRRRAVQLRARALTCRGSCPTSIGCARPRSASPVHGVRRYRGPASHCPVHGLRRSADAHPVQRDDARGVDCHRGRELLGQLRAR